jgi:hypothetical protein
LGGLDREDRVRSPQSGLRTVDVARRAGYSVQQVRDLEADGVLPPAARTASGYRSWTEVHVQSALAYRAVAAAIGPVEARRLLRAAYDGRPSRLLALLDAAHARLHTERRDVALAQEAAAAIAAEPIDEPWPSDAMGIAELAGALGVRTSTLRHWDAEGLVVCPAVRRAGRAATRRATSGTRASSPSCAGPGTASAPCGPWCRSCVADVGGTRWEPRWPPGTPTSTPARAPSSGAPHTSMRCSPRGTHRTRAECGGRVVGVVTADRSPGGERLTGRRR